MRLTICLLTCVLALGYRSYAQVSTVVSGEYFFDADPGFGQATPLPAFSSNQNVDVSFLASSSGLSKGMHMLGIRVFDSKSSWSMPVYTPIYVLASDPLTIRNISAAEYFFDVDPGVGNATSVAVGSAAPVVDFSFAAASSGLATGVHVLAVRTQNTLGEWSIATYTPVYVDRSKTISKLEYFFDTDPGVGNAVQIDVAPDTDVLDQIFSMNSSALAPATHTLGVRVAGQNNFWSLAETANFVICSAASPAMSTDVVCVGSATTFTDNSTTQAGDTYTWDFESDGTIDDVTAGNKSFSYPSAGTYTATLAIDRGGCVATTTATVTVDDVATVTAGPGQTICETGTAALIATVGGTASSGLWSSSGDGTFDNAAALNAVYTPGAADMGNGTATLTFTTEDPAGACPAVTATTPLTLLPVAAANAGADQNICRGTSVVLSGSRGGSASASAWSTSGDGTFDDAAALNATYSPGPNDIANGSLALTITTDDPAGACNAASDVMTLIISDLPTVDAGADVTICGNAFVTLNGTTGGPTTTYAWTTSGDGTFDNVNILTATYTPGASDLAAGSAVLTLTTAPAGACLSQSDQTTVTVTRDISLAAQMLNATIASPLSVSVTAGGTFNAGDVLTSSILTGPKKGTAQLQSGNMLRYVANSGTVGNDTVYVQVCNQCSQCDSQYIFFSIQNAPPVIDIPPASTDAGTTLIISIAASISDDNGNIDLSTATIVQQPASGASASIDANRNLVLDYTSVPDFSGTDLLTIEVCDDLDACAQHILSVQVGPILMGEVVVYNAVAPQSSGDNRYMRILNLPSGSKVSVYNRWGDKVFEVQDYDNATAGKRFEGNTESGTALPSGIYFYKIEIPETPTTDASLITGFLALKQ